MPAVQYSRQISGRAKSLCKSNGVRIDTRYATFACVFRACRDALAGEGEHEVPESADIRTMRCSLWIEGTEYCPH